MQYKKYLIENLLTTTQWYSKGKLYPTPIGLVTIEQNKKKITFLSTSETVFALELTQK